MKNALHKTLSCTLALLVLFSTFSFTVEKHFCGSTLIDKAVFSEAQTCGMESNIVDAAEDSCCTKEKTQVEGQDELKLSFESFHLNQQLFLTSFTYCFVNLFESLPRQVIPYNDYTPPLLIADIQVLDQVFLI